LLILTARIKQLFNPFTLVPQNNTTMGAFCSSDDTNHPSSETTSHYKPSTFDDAIQYHGDTCATVGLSQHANPPSPSPANLNKRIPSTRTPRTRNESEEGRLKESGSLYISATNRRSRIKSRNNGTTKQLTRDLNGQRVDLIKSERAIQTLTESEVDRLLNPTTNGIVNVVDNVDNAETTTKRGTSESSTATNNTSVYDSIEDVTKRQEPDTNAEEIKRETDHSVLHNLEEEASRYDLGRPVTTERKITRMTDDEVAKLLAR